MPSNDVDISQTTSNGVENSSGFIHNKSMSTISPLSSTSTDKSNEAKFATPENKNSSINSVASRVNDSDNTQKSNLLNSKFISNLRNDTSIDTGETEPSKQIENVNDSNDYLAYSKTGAIPKHKTSSKLSASSLMPFEQQPRELLASEARDFCMPTATATACAISISTEDIRLDEDSTCPLCYEIIKSSMDEHFRIAHKEYDCPFCSLFFESSRALDHHIISLHTEKNDDEKLQSLTDLNVEQDECVSSKPRNVSPFGSSSSKWYDTEDLDRLDIITDSSIRDSQMTYTCPLCQLEFRKQYLLEAHLDLHFSGDSEANLRQEKEISSPTGSTNLLASAQTSCSLSDLNLLNYKPNNNIRSRTDSLTVNLELEQAATLSDDETMRSLSDEHLYRNRINLTIYFCQLNKNTSQI
jgi:hypothetical protein